MPLPGAELSVILPLMASTICLVIISPKPVPPNLRVILESAWPKAVNNASCLSTGIPTPVSATETKIEVRSSSSSLWLMSTFIAPFSVNLIALLNKLIKTCFNRVGSPVR